MSTRQDWCRCTLWRSSSSRCCLPDAVVHQDFRTGTLAAHLCAHLCAGASCTSNGEEGCCDRGRARANCAVDAAGLHRAVPWLPLSLFSLRSVSRSVGTALCARWRKCGDGESAHVAARACRRARSRWNGLDGGPPPASSRRRQFCFQLHQVGHPRLLPDAACRHMMFQVHSKKPEEYETRLFDLLQTSTMAASR